MLPALVVGAGPAGLGTAAELGRRSIDAVILERGPALAAKWRASYDSLRINTSTWFSYLPGARFPRSYGQWPSRDQLVAYYERYAQERCLDVRLGVEARRIVRDGTAWLVETSGEPIHAGNVVIATAKDHTPVVPPWPGIDAFSGELLHSSAYRNAQPYADRSVLVVGAGNSAFDIAVDLLNGGARKVWLSIRTPPHIIHRSFGPVPTDLLAVPSRRLPNGIVDRGARALRRVTIGNLEPFGLRSPSAGLKTHQQRTGMIPTIDPGHFVAAVKSRRLPVVPSVERLEDGAAVLSDGSHLTADAVIAATGYRPGLEGLVGALGVLDDDGWPLVHGSRTHPAAAGVYFIGFTHPISGNLRELRLDARRIAYAVARGAQTGPR
jgi:putative flavoprotein involved in K+ transport